MTSFFAGSLLIPLHRLVLGIGEALVNLAIYRHNGDFAYASVLGIDVLKINAAWGWSMFATSTVLTLSILVKIMYVCIHTFIDSVTYN